MQTLTKLQVRLVDADTLLSISPGNSKPKQLHERENIRKSSPTEALMPG